MPSEDFGEVGRRIETLLERVAGADALSRARVEELVRSLLQFYGAGLERLLEIAAAREGSSRPLPERLAEDPLVAALLLLHGLHPVDGETRILQALEDLRPQLAWEGSDVTFLGLKDGVARFRLSPARRGRGARVWRAEIERAVLEAAPEVERVEVEESGEAEGGAGVREPWAWRAGSVAQ